jgi:DNA-binding transcriptional MerR regulator
MPEPAQRKDAWKAAEVCKAADVAPYVLKYWLTEFPVLSVDKDKGPNRIFTAREVEIISRIRQLLYDEGFTIAGAKKKIDAEISAGNFDPGKKKAAAAPAAAAPKPVPAPPPAPAVPPASPIPAAVDPKKIAKELREILKMLKA